MATRISPEFADLLHDEKCGGRPDPIRHTIHLGQRFRHYRYGELEEIVTVTPDNKTEIEDAINDRENDIDEYIPMRRNRPAAPRRIDL